MLLKWGSVSSQYWTEGQRDLFDLNQGWQERQLDQEVNYAQALFIAFQADYLTAGPNWVNNTCGEYDVTIFIHEDCGYGCQGVSFFHEGDPWESNEDRIDLFIRCVARATDSTIEYVNAALREHDFDFAKNY
jgi:hypothetical protein